MCMLSLLAAFCRFILATLLMFSAVTLLAGGHISLAVVEGQALVGIATLLWATI